MRTSWRKRESEGGGGGGEDTFIDAILTRKLNQKERNERPATPGGGEGEGWYFSRGVKMGL